MNSDNHEEHDSLTVGRLARRVGLSRSALLYYDEIGLLTPSGRTAAQYRVYTEADARRLERIMAYREAGLSLEDIRLALDAKDDTLRSVLHGRVEQIGKEIAKLRAQQRLIVSLLGQGAAQLEETALLDKDRWVAVLRASGLDDEGMRRWHVEFERLAPAAHADFLACLGIVPDDIEHIRTWSRQA